MDDNSEIRGIVFGIILGNRTLASLVISITHALGLSIDDLTKTSSAANDMTNTGSVVGSTTRTGVSRRIRTGPHVVPSDATMTPEVATDSSRAGVSVGDNTTTSTDISNSEG